jgi:hypothetical protein
VHFSPALLMALSGAVPCAAQWPLINEVLPSTGDQVEIFLDKGPPVDLKDYRLALNGKVFSIAASTIIGSGCKVAIDLRHAPLRLPRTGATLLLIAPDGITVVDVFTWKDVPYGNSVGRFPDGGTAVRYFTDPTIGTRTMIPC